MKPSHYLSKAFRRHHLLESATVLCVLFAQNPLQAQIVPDATLPDNSIVTPNGNTLTINGGTTAGSNLFHSFKQFSVLPGNEAFFNNTPTIQNILTRVTGGSISKIDGLVRANGTANLFLLNPSGIIFGPNASLNIGGSFLGSSAHSITFADGSQFSATEPQATPLLTVTVPLGLQFGSNPGAIRVQGTGHTLTLEDPNFSPLNRGSNLTGLRVQPGLTLALIGGDVALEGGTLTAEQGRILLGSFGSGLVNLNPTDQGWTLGYQGAHSFQDIQLSQRALADASGASGGSIQVQGRHVTLTDGSVILIQNQGVQAAGSISVNASESLELSGTTPDEIITSSLSNENLGSGQGGDITISTRSLVVQDGGQIFTRTVSAAPSGNITVNAPESVQVIGVSPFNPSVTSNILSTALRSAGDAGDVTVSTGRLSVLGGGLVASATLGTGSGGNVTVNATDYLELIGVEPIFLQPSSLGATTLSAGNGGNLTINTPRLVVRDGGRVDASALASGNAGSVSVNASESIEVSGTVPGSLNPSLVISSANILDDRLQQLFGLPPVPSGDSGNVTINTPRLSVTDGAQVNVKNDGTGNAGNLLINAKSIFLDNRGSLTASTTSGEGGNMTLQVQDLLQLRHNSQLSATAGGTGNGGDITIYTANLVAWEDSDITAKAVQGRGGNIQITTQGLFQSPDSEIIASSDFGIDGEVEITLLDIDPSRGLITLPTEPVDVTGLIAQGCARGGGTMGEGVGEFFVTGRGGLPPTPREVLTSDPALVDLGTPIDDEENHSSAAISRNSTISEPAPIAEATGWALNAKGEVVLTAQSPNGTPDIPWLTPSNCLISR